MKTLTEAVAKIPKVFMAYKKVLNDLQAKLIERTYSPGGIITGPVSVTYTYTTTTATTSAMQSIATTGFGNIKCKIFNDLKVQPIEKRTDEIKTAPDLIEYFVGFKVWQVVHRKDGYWLISPTYPADLWPHDRPYVARCEQKLNPIAFLSEIEKIENPHSAPNEMCKCGIYATYDVTRIPLGSFLACRCGQEYHFNIFGIIKGSGDVICAEEGFRAQYAEPVAFILPRMKIPKTGYEHIGISLARYTSLENIVDFERLACAYNVPLYHAILDYTHTNFSKLLSLFALYVNTDDPTVLTRQSEIFIYEGGIGRRDLGA